jgi:hypothetical protein
LGPATINDNVIDLISGGGSGTKINTFPGPKTIGCERYKKVRDTLTAEIDRRNLHKLVEPKACKKAWSAFYEKSFAAGGPLHGVFRPYEKENVRMFRNNIFKGIESDAEKYEVEISLGASPEDLPSLLCRAFKLNNEKRAARSAYEKGKEVEREKVTAVRTENEEVEVLLGLRNGGAVTPSPTNVVAAGGAVAGNPASVLGQQPGE